MRRANLLRFVLFAVTGLSLAGACHDFLVSHYEPMSDPVIDLERGEFSFNAYGRRWNLRLSLSNLVEGNAEHFQGQLEGDPKSVASVSLFSLRDITGMILTANETFWIEKNSHNLSDPVVYLHKQSDVSFNATECRSQFPATWSVDTGDEEDEEEQHTRRAISSYSVAVFMDSKWTDPNVNPWSSSAETLALFNDVNAIYAAAGLGQFRVRLFGTLNNPGLGSTSQMLNYFTSRQSGFDSSFTNSIWLVGSNVGGMAWVGSTCRQQSSQYRTAVSGLSRGSRLWTVKLIAHEMGHNRGAPHDFVNQCNGANPPGCQCSVMSYCIRSSNTFSQSSIDAMRSRGCL